MTTPLNTSLSLDNGGDLVAAVPYLLGFHPADSLVVLALVPDDGYRVGPVLRIDLPQPDHRARVARQLGATTVAHGADKALVLIVGGGSGTLTHRDLVDELDRAFDDVGVEIGHALWARTAHVGEQWWCYADPECNGIVPDPDAIPMAAAMAVAGLVKYSTREALADTLAPDPPGMVERRATLLDARIDARLHSADGTTCHPTDFARDMTLIDAAIADFDFPDTIRCPATNDPGPPGVNPDQINAVRQGVMPSPKLNDATQQGAGAATATRDNPDRRDVAASQVWAPTRREITYPGEPVFDDDRLVALAIALSHGDVRDACLRITLGPRARSADRLWTRLVRTLPAPERAEPACLLAIGAHLRGEGTLARIALEIAVSANPSHALAGLLFTAVDHCITPAELRNIIMRATGSA
ncbi:MAG: DUF4192 domain-containing protein [Actinomycetota bacterium]|nr:DUF4192 domain-containing protein [Actinomycetota bacterium]